MLLQSLYFSRFLPNCPRPLSSFDTHARWQPVTQSSRSRWSYGKIEDCEHSRSCSFRPKDWQNLIGRWCWLLGKRTIKLTVSFVTQQYVSHASLHQHVITILSQGPLRTLHLCTPCTYLVIVALSIQFRTCNRDVNTFIFSKVNYRVK